MEVGSVRLLLEASQVSSSFKSFRVKGPKVSVLYGSSAMLCVFLLCAVLPYAVLLFVGDASFSMVGIVGPGANVVVFDV